MRRWLLTVRKSTIYTPPPRCFANFHARLRSHHPHLRCLSSTVTRGRRSYDFERVAVRCASSGSIDVDLYNMDGVESSDDPILIYLPPYSTASSGEADVQADLDPPPFCRKFPTAVVHYRWASSSPFEVVEENPSSGSSNDPSEFAEEDRDDEFSVSVSRDEEGNESLNNQNTTLHWPTPFFDTMQAYDWIVSNLATPPDGRRAIYACGSHLGAPLATALALTESRVEEPMAVRGCIAFNGVYDWTTLLPDHPMNARKDGSWPPPSDVFEGKPHDAGFEELKRRAAALFDSPGSLFDPFASPSLFFYQPGLAVPQTFDEPTDYRELWLLDETLTPDQKFAHLLNAPTRPPRRSLRQFPPEHGGLRIPDMLLLHTTPPLSAGPSRFVAPSARRRRMRKANKSLAMHTFRGQAEELVAVARKSVNKFEIAERMKVDDDYLSLGNEATQRVQICEVGRARGGGGGGVPLELPAFGNDFVEAWLEDSIQRGHGSK